MSSSDTVFYCRIFAVHPPLTNVLQNFFDKSIEGSLQPRNNSAASGGFVPHSFEKLELIYLRGCPTVSLARELLVDVGLSFREICQDDLPPDHDHRRYASPTLLQKGEIIFGMRIPSGAKACLVQIPTERELLRRIYGDEDPNS